MSNILEVKDLSFSYYKQQSLLKKISFSLTDGEIFGLLGPNGSGKTTLIRQILFPTKENMKKIIFAGKRIDSLDLKTRAKMIGYIPQKLSTPSISVLQTVIMGTFPHSKSLFLKPTDQDRETALEALDQVGMKEFADRKLDSLSGGEIQRVFIAQSIAKDAKLCFFDEPMAALDPEYQRDFLKMILWLSEKGTTIVFTTHNPNHIFSMNRLIRVGVIDKFHVFKEVNMEDEDGISDIESAFGGAISIKRNQFDGNHATFFNVID